MPIWMSKKRWSKAVELGDERWVNYSFWNVSMKRRKRCVGPLHLQASAGRHECWDPHMGGLAESWVGSERWQGACYDRTRDVVAPTDFVVVRREMEITRREANRALAAERAGCVDRSAHEAKKALLFMSGSVSNSAPW